MMKLYLSPIPSQTPDNNGIGRIVHAQFRLLPKLGIQIIDDPNRADVIASHVRKGSLPRIDVLHCHGLYWYDLNHEEYQTWHARANSEIVEAAREAEIVTVPSEWVSMPFKRDMRFSPTVIGHGIDFSQWRSGKNGGYILWNKNRNADVCDATPALELARLGYNVWSTFMPVRFSGNKPKTMTVLGHKTFKDMKTIIEGADIYLATTAETFGIGTLEAMAAGVPILGYDWCGTSDLVKHKETGYLVDPKDINGLAEGALWLKEHRQKISFNCREAASQYDWEKVMPQYVDVYLQAIEKRKQRTGDATIVITSYNYGKYIEEAVTSALQQTEAPKEIIVVDDGSKDNTPEIMAKFANEPKVKYIRQENQGVAAARNNGIELAQTEFVTCLDADDRIGTNFVKILSGALRRDKGLGIAYSGLSFIQPDGRATPYSAWPPPFSWDIQSQSHNPPANCIPSACMFRKEMWRRSGGYEQQYAPGEDAHFWTKSLALGWKAEKVSEDGLHQYRTHDGSASRTKKYDFVDRWLPWTKDKTYPMGAPMKEYPSVFSYTRPAVSVITPVGPGHEKYVVTAIESVVGQTLREWELILIDDTGGDELKKYISRFPFIKVIKTAGGKGAGAARNAGLKEAKGQTVFFLDADDYISPFALEKMVMEYNRVGGDDCYIYCDWNAVSDKGEISPRHSPDYMEHEIKFQHAVSVLMKRETAQRFTFDEDLKSWEDWAFFIKARLAGVCGKRLPENLLYYSVDKGTRAEALNSPSGKKLLSLLQKRYKDYFERKNIMACGGCGKSGNQIIEIKRKMGLLPRETASEIAVQVAVKGDNTMKLEYTGEGTGSRTFMVKGTPYRAGNNPTNRIIVVKPEHVQKLMETGSFRLVNPPVAQEAPVQAPAQKVEVPKPEVIKKADSTFAQDIKAAKEIKEEKEIETQKEKTSYNKPIEARPMPGTLREIKAAFPTATMEDLLEWQTIEKRSDKPRKGVLVALDEEILER